MFFDSWAGIVRTVVVGALAYVALVVMLRVSGKRTLSKMYAFDLVVTVALGSILATILLSSEVALARGVTAFALLIGLQFVLTWLAARSDRFEKLIKSEPRLLLYQGQPLRANMRTARVSEAVLLEALRRQGVPSPSGVEAVVLEADGSFTVIQQAPDGPRSTMAGVQDYPPGA